MQRSRLVGVYVVALVTSVKAVTPLQKVVSMLQGMKSQVENSKHEEEVQYVAFKQFCDDVSLEKTSAVEKADARIESLTSHLQHLDTEAARLGREVLRHEEEIRGWSNDSEAAALVRGSELSDYEVLRTNYSQSIQALTKAISSLKAQELASVGSSPTAEAPGVTFQPPTEVYKFRSSKIVSFLEQLRDKFKDKAAEVHKEEVARSHAYDMLRQDLRDSIDSAKAAIESKATSKSRMEQESTEEAAELQMVTATRTADSQYLTDLTKECSTKSSDFQSRQQLRSEEVDALEKALEILSSSTVAGAAEKHLPAAALLAPKSTSLVSLRSRSASDPGEADKLLAVASLLRDASTRFGSRRLSAIAIRAKEDPFAKVKLLIEELLERLRKESTNEATQNGWCNTELATNAHTRQTRTEEIEILTAEQDKLTSNIDILKHEVVVLNAALVELNSAIANATDLRNGEKISNNQTVSEAKEAQKAIVDAISILEEFYSKASQAEVFTQNSAAFRHEQAPPPVSDSPYRGLQDKKSGVIGMLEVLQSDFARLERETQQSEDVAQAAYDAFMTDSAVDKAQKQKDIDYKSSSQAAQESELLDVQSKIRDAQHVLEGAQEAYEKLRPACLDTGMSYEERRDRRREEIEALKQALQILEDGV